MQSTSETDFYNSRINSDVLTYRNHWETSRDIKDIIKEFSDIEPGTRLKDKHESIIGRIIKA